jgi:Chlorophyll A-B binding protein
LRPSSTPFSRSLKAADPNAYAPPQIYDDAVADWNSQFPQFAKWGFGPSVHAEKWNGRHAMFGWFFICATAYCKGHGLIPDADTLLDVKEWGGLAIISGKTTISTERAIILAANMHFFGVSLMATMLPMPFSDSLTLDPNDPWYDAMAARNKQGLGFLPALKLGLTEEAEILNGRLAMLGLSMLVLTTALTGQSMIEVVNDWVGGAYFS